MDIDKLADARIRPARGGDDLERAARFLGTPRVREIFDGHPDERGCVRICEVEGEIVAALLIDPTPLTLRGVEVRCARLLDTGAEDGRAYFRRTGDDELFGFLLEEFLGYLWARRYPLAYAHGELALFVPHDFAPCWYHPRVYLDVAAALEVEAPYRVRRLKSDDIRAVAAMRRRDSRFRPQVYATGVRMFHHFCVENPRRKLRGYFSLEINPESTWTPPFFAPEIEVADRAAALTVLRHCADEAHAAGIGEMHFPLGLGHTFAQVCLELGGRSVLKGVATDPLLDEEMLHVVDMELLLQSLAPAFASNLAGVGLDGLAVTLPFATEKGCWEMHIDGREVSFSTVDDPPEGAIRLPHWVFTQLLVGYRGVTDLGVTLDADRTRLLRLLFPRTWPLSLSDPDHWESVAPPLPHGPKARERARSVELPWTRAW
jgi:hypothetical protein